MCYNKLVSKVRKKWLQLSAIIYNTSNGDVRNALINGDIGHYDWDSGYTCHQLGSGAVIVQLAQPYIVDSMR